MFSTFEGAEGLWQNEVGAEHCSAPTGLIMLRLSQRDLHLRLLSIPHKSQRDLVTGFEGE